MPKKPLKPCKHQGCPKLNSTSYCEDYKNLHRRDKDLFWDESNWQALCKKCHDSKTMTEDRYKEYNF